LSEIIRFGLIGTADLSAASVMVSLKHLEEMGYIERNKDNKKLIRPTEKGKQAAEKHKAGVMAALKELEEKQHIKFSEDGNFVYLNRTGKEAVDATATNKYVR